MSERSGVGLTELAVLEAADEATAGRPRAYARCVKVLGEIDRRVGLGPRYAYDLLLDLGRPWVTPVCLIAVRGNGGEPGQDSPAAGPAYTECRLSRAGEVVLAAERGELAPVPVGLITGTRYRSAGRPPWDAQEPTQPPLEPFRVLAALIALASEPGLSDAKVLELVGPPDFRTGCDVSGDLRALAAGRTVTLELSARITIAGERHLIIESLPPDVGAWEALRTITARAERSSWAGTFPELSARTELPIADAKDLSERGELRLEVTLRPGADPAAVRTSLRHLPGVAAEVQASFGAPLARLLRSWAGRHQGDDIAVSLAALGAAIRQDRQRDIR